MSIVLRKIMGALSPSFRSLQDVRLIEAAKTGDLHKIRTLIAAGADTKVAVDHWTALIWAIVTRRVEVIPDLIAAEADINARDQDDWTPLMFAACDGSLEIVQTLIAAGADVNAQDKDGLTAFDLAHDNRHQAVAELIQSHLTQAQDEPLALETAGEAP